MTVRTALRAALLSLIVTGAITIGGHAVAQEPQWYVGGTGLVTDDTRLYISEEPEINLIALGYTYVRVTSGNCDGSADEFAVYEGNITTQAQSSMSLYGTIAPTGSVATPLIGDTTAPNVFLFGQGDLSGFTVALEGLTPSVTFTACFRIA